MNMYKKVVAGAALAASTFGLATAASAAPTISYQILSGATVIGSGTTTTGSISLSGTGGGFTVSGNATAAPLLTSPNFSTNTFNISNGTAGTLTIRITTTDLTNYTGGTASNTFTLNSLTGAGFTSGTISTYFDSSNTAYGTSNLLATKTYSGSGSFSDTVLKSVSPMALFSETAIYTLNYSTSGNGTVSASAQLTAVPEPATWGLLIVGFGGVGFAMRRAARRSEIKFNAKVKRIAETGLA